MTEDNHNDRYDDNRPPTPIRDGIGCALPLFAIAAVAFALLHGCAAIIRAF